MVDYAAAHPIKLLEYGACGKPVVATRVTETEKIVRHGTHGYLASPNDPQEFAHYIVMLLNSPEQRDKMSVEFSKYIRENFDWNKLAQELQQVLRN